MFYAAGKSSQVLEFSLTESRVTRIFSLPEGSGAVVALSVFPGPFCGQVRLFCGEVGSFFGELGNFCQTGGEVLSDVLGSFI